MVAVMGLLGAVVVLSASTLILVDGPTRAPSNSASAVPTALPRPTQRAPRDRVDAAHAALHALGKACETPMIGRDRDTVRRPFGRILTFATAYPNAGFRIDGESGTTLALLIVVWDEVKSCDPALAPDVEDLIPVRYRGE